MITSASSLGASLAGALLVFLPSCGGGDDRIAGTPDSGSAGSNDAPVATDAAGPDAAGPDAAPALAWQTIIDKSWTLSPGSEDWQCRRIVLTEDTYVGAIRPIAPVGTHHTLLMLDRSDSTPCDGGTKAIIYASGVGTGELRMPAGVGLKLPAGQALDLQVHLFNPADNSAAGTSGVQIVKVAAADAANEAEVFLPGPLLLDIPTGVHTLSGTCTITQSQTLFAVFPHMHQLGTYLKATAMVGNTPIGLTDGAYDFYDQKFSPITPITLSAGDKITTECTWNNTTGSSVAWGNSSTQEMCFTILYRYPRLAIGDTVFCDN